MSSTQSLVRNWTYDTTGRVASYADTKGTTSYSYGVPVAVYANGIPVVRNITYNPAGGLAGYTTGHGYGHDELLDLISALL